MIATKKVTSNRSIYHLLFHLNDSLYVARTVIYENIPLLTQIKSFFTQKVRRLEPKINRKEPKTTISIAALGSPFSLVKYFVNKNRRFLC